MPKILKSSVLFLFFFLFLFSLSQSQNLTRPQSYVSDFAGVIDRDSKSNLELLIHNLVAQTSVEIAVVTIKSTEGIPIEEYAVNLFSKWGIGKKGVDNGVLVLVALKEKKVKIEVGYGLEGILPDGLCGEIIRRNITPEFRNGNYGAGLISGVQRIIKIIQTKGESEKGTGKPVYKKKTSIVGFIIFFIIFFIFFRGGFLPLIFLPGARRGGRGGFGGGFWTGGSGGGGFSGGFGGFGGGSSGGGGATGGW